MTDQEHIDKLRAVLQVILDQVDYTTGACGPVEMVAACLPVCVIDTAREVLEETK